ncbi:hypothetical protein D3C77_702790 [compost metagenome]
MVTTNLLIAKTQRVGREPIRDQQAEGCGVDVTCFSTTAIQGAIHVEVERDALILGHRNYVVGIAVVLIPDVLEAATV